MIKLSFTLEVSLFKKFRHETIWMKYAITPRIMSRIKFHKLKHNLLVSNVSQTNTATWITLSSDRLFIEDGF